MMDKERVNKYKTMLMKVYKNKVNVDKLFEKCDTLYSSQAQEEYLKIGMNKVKGRIKLPYPKNIIEHELITKEEKECFWKPAFINKGTNTYLEQKTQQNLYSHKSILL